jgi:hypothetical protein
VVVAVVALEERLTCDELKGHDADRPGVERKRLEREERAASSVYGPTPRRHVDPAAGPAGFRAEKARTRTRPVATSRTKASGGTEALENLSPK